MRGLSTLWEFTISKGLKEPSQARGTESAGPSRDRAFEMPISELVILSCCKTGSHTSSGAPNKTRSRLYIQSSAIAKLQGIGTGG